MGISLKPSMAVESTGFMDDVQATITKAEFVLFDYNGKSDTDVPCLHLALQVDGEESEHDQYYSMGRVKDFTPSKDGKTLQSVGTAQSLNASTNGMIFLGSLVNSGFPEDKIDDDISVLSGTVAHFIRQPAPKRSNQAPKKEGDRDPTILVIDQIISLPGEDKKGAKKGAKATTASKAAPTGKAKAAATEEDGGIEEETQGIILEILSEKPDGITKQQLPALIFAKAKTNPNKNAIVQVAFKDDFLGDGDRPWTFADGKITLG